MWIRRRHRHVCHHIDYGDFDLAHIDSHHIDNSHIIDLNDIHHRVDYIDYRDNDVHDDF